MVDGRQLGRHNIPLVNPGDRQSIPLRDLPESLTNSGLHTVEVITINRTGQQSQPAQVKGELFSIAPVSFPKVRPLPAATPPISDVAVIPVTDKYDREGRAVGDLPPGYRTHNSLYDGQCIHLKASAGEVVGFQVLLRGDNEVSVNCHLDPHDWRVDLFQAKYVPTRGRQIPDPLVPLPETIPLNRETDQAVFVDCYVPFETIPGEYDGKFAISDGRKVPLKLTVLPIRLPRKASFLCEMNSYGLPDHVDDYYALQQVAYDHRVHANILHYSHHTAAPGARKSNLDMRLRSGRRMNNQRYDAIEPGAKQAYWDDFEEAFGPFLDGSYFQDDHRGRIQAPGFYLTFHESWPLNCRAFFNGDPDAYRAFADSPAYAETYVNVLSDFVRLAKSRGWTETGCQVYFNNKGSLNEQTKAPWILDEPSSYWDYRALQYYGELTGRGRREASDVQIDYRIDISRPEFCRGELAGRGDLWVVSSSAFQNYRRLITDRQIAARLLIESTQIYTTSPFTSLVRKRSITWPLPDWHQWHVKHEPWHSP